MMWKGRGMDEVWCGEMGQVERGKEVDDVSYRMS